MEGREERWGNGRGGGGGADTRLYSLHGVCIWREHSERPRPTSARRSCASVGAVYCVCRAWGEQLLSHNLHGNATRVNRAMDH